MAKEPLKYLSNKVSEELYDTVEDNLERYLTGDFESLLSAGGWSIELSLNIDLSVLNNMVTEKGADAEIENTLLIWSCLNKLSPSLACENRLWTRLTHVECLDYSRARWLSSSVKSNSDRVASIKSHFFANTQTRCRDDNAIGRLWWNALIAKMASPHNHQEAISMILKTADIRSGIIERSRTASRPVVAAAIVRKMMEDDWIIATERNFRDFMVALNRLGAGKVFEYWSESEMSSFMARCVLMARAS